MKKFITKPTNAMRKESMMNKGENHFIKKVSDQTLFNRLGHACTWGARGTSPSITNIPKFIPMIATVEKIYNETNQRIACRICELPPYKVDESVVFGSKGSLNIRLGAATPWKHVKNHPILTTK